MINPIHLAISLLMGIVCIDAHAQDTQIILIRHGEKPAQGLGQLNCQGLNRALALPAVLERQFGRADAVFAPNPTTGKKDSGVFYDYIRPLATIEPTAVALGLPIDTQFSYKQTAPLSQVLLQPKWAGKLVVVVWEHKQIIEIEQQLMGAQAQAIPKWSGQDFDRIDVLRLSYTDGHVDNVTYRRAAQGLNDLSTQCPVVGH